MATLQEIHHEVLKLRDKNHDLSERVITHGALIDKMIEDNRNMNTAILLLEKSKVSSKMMAILITITGTILTTIFFLQIGAMKDQAETASGVSYLTATVASIKEAYGINIQIDPPNPKTP